MSLAAELKEMNRLKQEAEALVKPKQSADEAFKTQQAKCLRLMEADEADSFRTGGVLYTAIPDRMKGQVDDRSRFVRWALEQDDGIQEFIETYVDREPSAAVEAFYAAIMGTEVVTYKENGTACNSMAKAHVDDEVPLPPGLSFRPDPYIQRLSS
jgi:hypothetical protein